MRSASILVLVCLFPLVCLADLPQDQATALLTFGKAIGYDYTRYATRGDLCQQLYYSESVKCFNNTVVSISLNSNGGFVPRFVLTHFPKLTALTLRGFGIKGSVESGVHVPFSLQVLDIASTSIQAIDFRKSCNLLTLRAGQLNSSYFDCPSLNSLYLTGCRLPTFYIRDLKNVTTIEIWSSSFGDRLEFTGSSKLNSVILNNNTINTLSFSGGNTSGISLKASGNGIKKFIAFPSTKFSLLDLSNNNLTSFDYTSTQNMQWVDVSNNQLTRVGLNSVQLDQVNYCNFAGNRFACPVSLPIEQYCFATCN